MTAGEPWTLRDEEGDAVEVYAVEWEDPTEKLTNRVAVNVPTHDGPALDLPRLRALIAELTRRAALLAGEAGDAPARTAEDERRDAHQALDDAGAPADSLFERIQWLTRRAMRAEAHLLPWRGDGWYAGRDGNGDAVLLRAEAPAGLARIGAAAGVARWSGPHASLADAGKALDAEGGQ